MKPRRYRKPSGTQEVEDIQTEVAPQATTDAHGRCSARAISLDLRIICLTLWTLVRNVLNIYLCNILP